MWILLLLFVLIFIFGVDDSFFSIFIFYIVFAVIFKFVSKRISIKSNIIAFIVILIASWTMAIISIVHGKGDSAVLLFVMPIVLPILIMITNLKEESSDPAVTERDAMLEKERERERKRKLRQDVRREMMGLEPEESERRRERIPQEVMDKVWIRDGGRCVYCGSNHDLEFDHIIPFSKGGSNTYRNIQLLCEKCNREKSAKIG